MGVVLVSLVHFGHQHGAHIDMGAFGGSHGSPKRSPEHPGVAFGGGWGGILGSVLGHFRPKNDARIKVKSTMIFECGICRILVVFGLPSWASFGPIWLSGNDCQ